MLIQNVGQHLVLNGDFSKLSTSPQQALDATTAHEFNHAIQYGYGALAGPNVPDDSFFEGGASEELRDGLSRL